MTLPPFQLFYVFLIFSHEACSNLKTGENTLKKIFFEKQPPCHVVFQMFFKVPLQHSLALECQAPERKHVLEPESVSGGSPVAASVPRSGLQNRAGAYPRCAFTRAHWVDTAVGPTAQTPP